MDFKLHLERGWKTVWNFVGPVLLLTVVQLIISVMSLGLLAPVTAAGYMHSILLALREDRTPEVRDLFSQMSLFLPLFLFGLAVVVVISIGFMLLFLPGVILSIILAFACLYVFPLMTDRKMKIMDAIQESWDMAKREPVSDQIIITIIYLAVYSLGSSLPFGIIVAQPVATAILLSVYEERIGNSGSRTVRTEKPEEYGPVGPPPPPPQEETGA